MKSARQEQLLIEALDAISPGRILCTSQGVAARLAAAAAAKVRSCDRLLPLPRSLPSRKGTTTRGDGLANLTLGCSSDFPPQSVDLAALPLSTQGEAELTRELLQSGASSGWPPGGVLSASTDNPRDRWLHEEMRTLFATVTRRESPLGTVYVARRDRPLKRVIGNSVASSPSATAVA